MYVCCVVMTLCVCTRVCEVFMYHSFRKDKCPENMDDVPDFMSLSEFNLHPEKQIVSVFLNLARDDGYIYAEDLAADKVCI